MAEHKWTKPQWDAITAGGGSLLVSAAAGSGKTAVLAERAIRLICGGENPVPADRLLVMTFSNAAATEMKQRIGALLSAMIAEDPANTFLLRQQTLLQSAQISTIHAFCLELIRQNFQDLDISPDFNMADENEMQIMEHECARECVEEFYEKDESGIFFELVELLSSGRDDSRLIETLLKIHHFSRSHPFPESWLDEKQAMYNSPLPVGGTAWGETLLRYGVESLSYCRRIMLRGLDCIQGDAALEKGYLKAFQSDLMQIGGCLSAAEDGDWDTTVERLRAFSFERLGGVRGDDAAKVRAKSARDRSKKIISDLSGKYLNATNEDFCTDMEDLKPKIEVLFALVKSFGKRLWQIKGEKKRLDFSDLEHLALQLLAQQEGEGWHPTARAGEISGRYAMVMVDEYQDTNEVQDMIFTSVSNMQRNLFMVGDVKQSIYSFRQAMPEIFLRKKQAFFPYESGQFPAKIILDTNFRSRREVTQGINYLFSMMMSEDIGEMEYTTEESLKYGARYPEHPGAEPEILFLEGPEESGESTGVLEARSVAQKIAGLLREGYPVSEGDALRPVRPGDICILLRSHKNRADSYVQALLGEGVSAWAETSGGYLQTREVSMVVSLLRALDNPLLDVELVAALMSPLFAFTDDDIARVRLVRRGEPFYTALAAAAEEGDEKSGRFLRLFAQMRMQAAVLPADRLLMHIYDVTDALAVIRGMLLGESRAANLHLLVEYAAAYHQLGYKRLGGFVSFLNRLEERGGDLERTGGAGAAAGDAVRVISIHKSKGLEFPVVFLCDTFRKFNKMDLRTGTQLHSRLGFACVRRRESTLRQFSTIPMQAIRLESERSLLSEELRILYVALTRAREKLFITGLSRRDTAKRLVELGCELKDGRLPSYAVREGGCYADWIMMAMLHHASAAPLWERSGLEMDDVVNDGNPWTITLEEAAASQTESTERQELPRTAKPDPEIASHLKRVAAFVYPYQNQASIPAKLAVSAVAKGGEGLDYKFSARPQFMEETKLTGAEKGNALHKFMQFSDYNRARDNLEDEIRRMGEKGFLSRPEVESLRRAQLRKFFNGPLAKRIFASDRVCRELKFTAECGRDILGGYLTGMDDEAGVVLQGVADCVFFEEDGAVIVDYKTDGVESAEELVRRYEKQLLLYREILSGSLETKIKQCLLYSFRLGQEIEVF